MEENGSGCQLVVGDDLEDPGEEDLLVESGLAELQPVHGGEQEEMKDD